MDNAAHLDDIAGFKDNRDKDNIEYINVYILISA